MSAAWWAEKQRSLLQDLEPGFMNLEAEQLTVYKLLRAGEIEARERTMAFLDSLLPAPLSREERDRIHALRRSDFLSGGMGDGLDEDYPKTRTLLDAEVADMSDYEFSLTFGTPESWEAEYQRMALEMEAECEVPAMAEEKEGEANGRE